MDIIPNLDIKQILNRTEIPIMGVMSFSDISTLIDCKAKARLPENAKSVIMCAFPYYVDLDDDVLDSSNVCRYAMFVDYHKYIPTVLDEAVELLSQKYGGTYAVFSDISPIPEVFAGVQAGLGFLGKNGLLITKEYGSYVLLGEIVTDLEIEIDKPFKQKTCCQCMKCLFSCPNGAILSPCGNMNNTSINIDYSACMSEITQRKGELTPQEVELIRETGKVWGCDQCQDVCPHNSKVKPTKIQAFLDDIEPNLNYNNLDDLKKTRPYGYKGKTLLTRNLDIINVNNDIE